MAVREGGHVNAFQFSPSQGFRELLTIQAIGLHQPPRGSWHHRRRHRVALSRQLIMQPIAGPPCLKAKRDLLGWKVFVHVVEKVLAREGMRRERMVWW